MQKFKYKFTKLIIFLMLLGLAFCAACFTVNLVRYINNGISDAYDVIQYSLFAITSLLFAVIIVSCMINSYYGVTDDKLIIKFGVIKSVVLIKDITALHLFKKTKKLVTYFGEDKFMAIIVKEEWYDEFIDSIMSRNKNIVYDVTSEDEDIEKKDDK